MKILMIAINDPAGTAINFTKAINKYTEHTCRLITTATKYNFEFETDIHLPAIRDDEFDEIEELLKNADIIHFHTLADEHLPLGPVDIKNFLKDKKIVHHHHGHPDFRSNPGKYREKYRKLRRKVLVSTPDLLKLLPESIWQPNLVPVNDPLYMPVDLEICPVRIGQSPTRKDLKNTEELIYVVNKLMAKSELPSIKLEIIENCRHIECLIRKKQCHIIFDHIQGYYGVSSLEALSQGKSVIAGLDEWNIRCIKEFVNGASLPWVIARDVFDLEERLKELILDKDLRDRIGKYARKFMEEFWSESCVIQKLINFYETL